MVCGSETEVSSVSATNDGETSGRSDAGGYLSHAVLRKPERSQKVVIIVSVSDAIVKVVIIVVKFEGEEELLVPQEGSATELLYFFNPTRPARLRQKLGPLRSNRSGDWTIASSRTIGPTMSSSPRSGNLPSASMRGSVVRMARS